jgi:hypothetical protein
MLFDGFIHQWPKNISTLSSLAFGWFLNECKRRKKNTAIQNSED